MDAPPVWHEDPEFWERFQDILFPPEKIERAGEQVEQLRALIDLESDAEVVDIPCGIGRHAIELADRGFPTTAVDATHAYVETARERARDADVDAEFLQADMREFRRDESFDAIFNLYTSFGYFEERDDDERTLRNFYESLTPGGTLVMALTSKETLAGKFRDRTWDEQNGTYILEEHQIADNWNWIENRWIVVEDDDAREFAVSHRLYSAFELSELLERVGFSDIAVYGDLDGADYDENAKRLVVVARKD
jgi:SAM-dependent methyltransferase